MGESAQGIKCLHYEKNEGDGDARQVLLQHLGAWRDPDPGGECAHQEMLKLLKRMRVMGTPRSCSSSILEHRGILILCEQERTRHEVFGF